MPDSKKITIKTKVTINTISDDVEARNIVAQSHSSSSSRDANRSILNDDENNEPNGFQRQSSKRHSSSRRKKVSSDNSNNAIETISLQENNNERRAVPSLKASFLRRKMKEYEGNKNQLAVVLMRISK